MSEKMEAGYEAFSARVRPSALRCRVQLRTRRGALVGTDERFKRGVLVARGVDSVGRVTTVRRRVRL